MSESSKSPVTSPTNQASCLPFDDVIAKCTEMMEQYWRDYPELKAIVAQRNLDNQLASNEAIFPEAPTPVKPPQTEPLMGPLRGRALRSKIGESHRIIRESIKANHAEIVPRTQAHNRKCAHPTFEEAQEERADLIAAQLKTWRSVLPTLVRRFSKLSDYRRATHTKHKITVLMLFGLFAFIFRLQSRREINRELTGPVIFEQLRKMFPELDSIPHADTLARALENIDPKKIEAIHVSLIRDLIRKKSKRQFTDMVLKTK